MKKQKNISDLSNNDLRMIYQKTRNGILAPPIGPASLQAAGLSHLAGQWKIFEGLDYKALLFSIETILKERDSMQN